MAILAAVVDTVRTSFAKGIGVGKGSQLGSFSPGTETGPTEMKRRVDFQIPVSKYKLLHAAAAASRISVGALVRSQIDWAAIERMAQRLGRQDDA
ncbi:MAG: hypothetical protein SH850_30990 [Planctomycetaceae bacterium]|nr:hypothetical protein [Planctomycetaceae bacterium]